MTSVSSLGSAIQLPVKTPPTPVQKSGDGDHDNDAQTASVAKDADKMKTSSVNTLT